MERFCYVAIATAVLIISCSAIKQSDHCLTNRMINCEEELVLVGVCLTGLSNDSDVAAYGYCPYFAANKTVYVTLYKAYYYHINFSYHLTEQTCGPLNRKGLLCSECYEGYGPAVYAFSNECVSCHGSVYGRWALHLFVSLFPITVFYIMVITFNICAASPPFTAYVLFCQLFSSLNRIYFSTSTNVDIHDPSQALLLLARTLSGVWNLDIGRYIIPPFCVSENLTTYHSLFLNLLLGFYPMMLIFISYILIELHANNFKLIVFVWKPFHKCFVRMRRSWDPRASIVNTFATFLLLSLSKILFISSYPLQTISKNVYDADYIPHLLLYDPSTSMHSVQNIPFIVLGISLALTFAVIPTFFLCCYQVKMMRRLLFTFLGHQRQHTFDLFMDAFQGHYKDGTNGTCDYRFLSGAYPLLRIMFIYNIHKHVTVSLFHHLTFVCFTANVIIAFTRPYKKFHHNLAETVLLTLTTFMVWNSKEFLILDSTPKSRIVVSLLQLLPHSILLLWIILKILRLLNVPSMIKKKTSWLGTAWSRINEAIERRSLIQNDAHLESYGTV